MKMNVVVAALILMLARPFYVMAEDACRLQADMKALVPYDVNAIDDVLLETGAVLPPTSTAAVDSNGDGTDFDVDATWHVAAGKLQRTAPYCCEAGWSMTEVAFIDGTTRATTTFDALASTWTMTAEVVPGLNWWYIRAVNAYTASSASTSERLVLVTCWGDLENKAPVLY